MLNNEVKDDSDSDYEDEFDRIRDPNIDMMFYVKQMPKMQRLRDVSYDIDMKKGALEYLFEEREEDGEYVVEERDYLNEDGRIDGFTGRLTKKWGREESQLRTAIYISFVKDSDTMMFRKKIKKAR